MVVDAAPSEQMGIETGIAFLFVAQAIQDELHIRCGEFHLLRIVWGCSPASKLNDLAPYLGAIRLGAGGDSAANRALTIGFAAPGRLIPLLAIECGAPEQAVPALSIFAGPEGQQVAQGQFCLRLGGVAGGSAVPQRPKGWAIFCVHGPIE